MRSMNILDEVIRSLYEYAVAIPEVFMHYDVSKVELQVDDYDRPTVFDIVFVESEETELVIGEIVLSEDFTATFDIFDAE